MSDVYLISNLIGFTIGLLIAMLLVVLAVRAAQLPGTPTGSLFFAVCAFLWNGGGFVKMIVFMAGFPKNSLSTMIAGAIQFTGAALWPVPTLMIWRSLAQRRFQEIARKILLSLAIINGIFLMSALWFVAIAGPGLLSIRTLASFTAYNGSILLLLAAAFLFRRPLASPSVWFYSVVTALGLFAATLLIILSNLALPETKRIALTILSEQSVFLIVVGAFFLFVRFRFADLFILNSIRIIMAAGLAVSLILLIRAPSVAHFAAQTAYPKSAEFFIASILAATLLLAFSMLDRSTEHLANRWFFRAHDYRRSTKELIDTLRVLYAESEISASAEEIVQKTLGVEAVHVLRSEILPPQQWPPEMSEGEIVELSNTDPLRLLLPHSNINILVPVRVGSRVSFVLAICRAASRRSLLTHEVQYVRDVAMHLGNRLDLLKAEREMVERRTRETLLQQQLTDAELRSLRSQINPHFLFNALNTIADLIATNPEKAELMTLRLAKTFRHVLAQSSRSLTSVQQEIEFVRTYLYIEEVRFGERLQVNVDIAPEVSAEQIPSLILQPLVENALKHGLAPKIGVGNLWISARLQDSKICLKVEDDGVGLAASARKKPNGPESPAEAIGTRLCDSGVGLANISQRLKTLYRDSASLSIEAGEKGGSRVTLLLPKSA